MAYYRPVLVAHTLAGRLSWGGAAPAVAGAGLQRIFHSFFANACLLVLNRPKGLKSTSMDVIMPLDLKKFLKVFFSTMLLS